MAKHTLSIQSEYLNKLKFLLHAIQFVFYFVLIWLHWITGSILVKNMLPHSTGQKIRRHNYALSVQDWCYNTAILNVTVTENIVSMKEGITEAHGGHWWKNASCALALISKFVLLLLGRYLCVWTMCPRVYHPPSSQCLFNLSFVWTRLIYYIFWKSREAIPFIHFGGLTTELIYRVYREEMNEAFLYLVIPVLDIHHIVLSQFMACQRMINKITTTGPTSRAGITYSSGETVFNSGSTEVQAVHFLRIPVHVTLVVLRCVMSTLIVASKLFNSSLHPFVFVGDSCFICYLHWFLYRYPTLFIFKIMFVSFKRNMTWAASGTRTANFLQHMSSYQMLSAVRVARSSVFGAVFCRPLFVCLLSLFVLAIIWRLLINTLVMCDVRVFLTFTSLNWVLLWQLFYLFCSSIGINTVIVTAGTFEP